MTYIRKNDKSKLCFYKFCANRMYKLKKCKKQICHKHNNFENSCKGDHFI